MQRQLIHGFLAALLMVTQLCAVFTATTVHAVSKPTVHETVIDTDDLTVSVTGEHNGEHIAWTINYQRQLSATDRALRLQVTAQDLPLNPVEAKDWQAVVVQDADWWQEAAFSKDAKGSLHFETDAAQRSLTLHAQLDETPDLTKGLGLLHDDTAGPHTVTLPQATEEAPQAPAVDAEAAPEAEAKEDPEEASAPEADATPEASVSQNAAESAEAQPAVAPLEAVLQPTGDPFTAHNLVLSLTANATVALNVTGNAGTAHIYTKSANSNRNKYGSRGNMENDVSTDYIAGSSARAVIFDHYSDNQVNKAVIELSYTNVGYVQAANGTNVPVGAYVKVSNITHRAVEWNNQNNVGIDFSSNFYSGISIANIRHFDWEVTFFRADTRQPINFASDSTAKLTFTSLNPGEFVRSDNGLKADVADPNFVKETKLSESQLAPDNRRAFEAWVANGWPQGNNPISGYTAHKWGDWDTANPQDIDVQNTWQDRLGTPTFGNGAVGFTLIGTTFGFTRGTYSQANSTWLANASGEADLNIPADLTNNKSISSTPVSGGGDAQAAVGDIYTKNDLDGQNINQQASDKATMYYYINQKTYSVVEDVLGRPTKIVISDLLPAGMKLASDRYADNIKVFNERDALNSRERELAHQVDVQTINGRQQVTITIEADEVMKIPFKGGFFSAQLMVKTDHDPETITQKHVMTNTATVEMFDHKAALRYSQTTNPVTVEVTPVVKPVNIAFAKHDDLGQGISGVSFGLFANATGGDALHTAESRAQGQVAFTQIDPGQYWLGEISTPAGYVPLAERIQITVNKDGTITWPKNWQHGNTVVNPRKPTTIGLKKTDPAGRQLRGAEFALQDADGKVLQSGTTDSSGLLTFGDYKLMPGTYKLKETKAPSGFLQLEGEFTFMVKLDGTTVLDDYSASDLSADQYQFSGKDHQLTITIENQPYETVLPVTGGNGTHALWAVAALLIGLAVALGWHFRKEDSR